MPSDVTMATTINIRISDAGKAELKELADLSRRSLSGYLVWAGFKMGNLLRNASRVPSDNAVGGDKFSEPRSVDAVVDEFLGGDFAKPVVKPVGRTDVNRREVVVLELIGCDVNDQFSPPKPRMALRHPFSAYVVKFAAYLQGVDRGGRVCA